MDWLMIAAKNVVRRPVRSLLTLAGVAIAVAMLFSLLEFQRGYEKGLRGELGQLGAHIMIVPRGCPYEAATIVLHGGKWPSYMQQQWYDIVKSTPGVAESTAIIMDAVIQDGGAKNTIYMGIDEDYPRLRPDWDYDSGGWFSSARSVILGASAAKSETASVGDEITISDGTRIPPTKLRVAGILKRTNTQDDGLIFLPQATLQSIFNLQGKLVVVLVKVTDVTRTDEVVERLRAASRQAQASMNVFPLSELLGTLTALLSSTKVFVLAIVVVALLVGGVGVLTTILMTVYERTQEIGMMKATGAGWLDIFRIVWLETLLLTVAGGFAGVGLALLSARGVVAVLRHVLPYAPDGFALGFSAQTFWLCIGASVVLGLAAGSYPAMRAASISPIAAIRGGGL